MFLVLTLFLYVLHRNILCAFVAVYIFQRFPSMLKTSTSSMSCDKKKREVSHRDTQPGAAIAEQVR